MNIEIIILAALALVFVVDYFVRNKKKSKTEIESKPKKDNLQNDRPKKEKTSNKITFLIISLNVVITVVILIFYEGSFSKQVYALYVPSLGIVIIETIHFYFVNVIFLLNKRFFNYISNRPKNLILFSIFVFLSKLCIHYFLYAKQKKKTAVNTWERYNQDDILYEEFVWHLENILTVETKLFIPALAICIIVSYLISDKIKAR